MLRRNFFVTLLAPLVARFAPKCKRPGLVPVDFTPQTVPIPFKHYDVKRLHEINRKLLVLQLYKAGYIKHEYVLNHLGIPNAGDPPSA